ncbi:MAG: preprotein translocase subunit SecG [Bacteroidota bacterium]
MTGLFQILLILGSGLMIFVVVIQNSKGGGLSSTFGGGAASQFGARRSNEAIEKITWYLAAGMVVIAFVANIFAANSVVRVQESKTGEDIENFILASPTVQDPTAAPAGGEGSDNPAE